MKLHAAHIVETIAVVGSVVVVDHPCASGPFVAAVRGDMPRLAAFVAGPLIEGQSGLLAVVFGVVGPAAIGASRWAVRRGPRSYSGRRSWLAS